MELDLKSIELIDEKVERILELKELTVPYLEKYFYNQEMQFSEENNKLAQKIVDHSLTKVCGNDVKLSNKTLVVVSEIEAFKPPLIPAIATGILLLSKR